MQRTCCIGDEQCGIEKGSFIEFLLALEKSWISLSMLPLWESKFLLCCCCWRMSNVSWLTSIHPQAHRRARTNTHTHKPVAILCLLDLCSYFACLPPPSLILLTSPTSSFYFLPHLFYFSFAIPLPVLFFSPCSSSSCLPLFLQECTRGPTHHPCAHQTMPLSALYSAYVRYRRRPYGIPCSPCAVRYYGQLHGYWK